MLGYSEFLGWGMEGKVSREAWEAEFIDHTRHETKSKEAILKGSSEPNTNSYKISGISQEMSHITESD